MDSVYDLVRNLNENNIVINADIESHNSLFYTQSFYFSINKDTYDSYCVSFKQFSEFIIVNGYEFNDNPEIELEGNSVQISIENDFFSDSEERFNEYIMYDEEVFNKFSKLFFNKIKISNLKYINMKAKVKFLTETNLVLKNSIFNDSELNEELFIPNILLSDGYYSSIKVIAVPNIVPEFLVSVLLKDIIQSQFELVSDHFISKEKFIIYSDKNVSFEMDDVDLSKELKSDLEDIIRFIFEDERHYYDKLEIFKNVFSVNRLKQKEINRDLSKGLLEDIKSQYSLFVSDSLDKFIRDKQIITDKYILFLQNISEQTKKVSDEIQKQILTLIGIVISTFFIKGIEEGIGIILPSLLGLIYLGVSFYLKSKSGWNENSDFFRKEIVFMNETYGELYKFDSEYTDKLLKDYVYPAISKLELSEERFKRIYFVFLLMFLVWFLYA